jgi:hypothetical protein
MILYADADYDITSDVMKEINKDRPAASATTTPATPADTNADSPKITLPGAKKP